MRRSAAVLAVVAAGGVWAVWARRPRTPPAPALEAVPVVRRDIARVIKATGEIGPRDLVPVRAPVLGRVDKALVDTGRRVRQGQVLAVMSSADRAAVLDEALSQGATVYRRWEQFYQPTNVVAPVSGLVISRDAVEGQTVRPGDPLFTIADELIVRADVDETDVGALSKGQEALLKIDAEPGRTHRAVVESVGLQARQVDGVNLFPVALKPVERLDGLRTGMSAEVEFLADVRSGALALPAAAVRGKERTTLRLPVLASAKGAPELRDVVLGVSDGRSVEVLSGVPEGGAVLVPRPGYLDDGARRHP